MSRPFGIGHHFDAEGGDDGSDAFVIEKYRSQIINHTANDSVFGVGDFYEVEISHPVGHEQPQSDSAGLTGNTAKMNDITREELNAKLETIEVKMDARIESVSSKIDGFLAAQAERDKRLDAALAQIGKDNSDTRSSIGSMKTTLIVTAVSTALAIVLGIAGFNTALTSNMISAFQLGKSEQQAASASAAPTATPPTQPVQSPESTAPKKPAH